MSTVTLTFDLDNDDDRKEFARTNNATKAYIALNEIANEIFRPARKHGYPDSALQQMINNTMSSFASDGEEFNPCLETISKLEDMFYAILENRGINLEDLE